CRRARSCMNFWSTNRVQHGTTLMAAGNDWTRPGTSMGSSSTTVAVVEDSANAPSRTADGQTLLLQFIHERDVPCPRCDYNLRNLTVPTCPECHEPLRLAVGLRRPKFGWLIAALAPGIFSGIAAFFMGGMLILMTLSPRGKVIWQPVALDGFGWLSAIGAG